jgi:hypothetical protein
MDYASQSAVDAAWPGKDVRACFRSGSGWSCPHPGDLDGVRRIAVSQAAFARMQAQIHNPADGWDDPEYAPYANSEPVDPLQIKGNFTAREASPRCGYAVTVGLGHTGDYNGYTVTYREYQARDSYRKALTSYGPHTADYMVTRLMAMAANLRCGTEIPAEPTEALVAADEARQTAEAVALGQLSSAALDGWAAQLPDSAGAPAGLVQPKDISRFDAAWFRWVGGDSFTDQPVVTVQRLGERGWLTYARQDGGEVQTVIDQPAGVVPSLVDNRTNAQRWTWTASFEAYDAYPRATLAGGQVPAGRYRFAVRGHVQRGGAPVAYSLVSQPFDVRPWAGVSATSLVRRDDGSVAFTTPDVVYPRSYSSPIRFVHDDGGGKPGAGSLLCRTCTFRPWATGSEVVSAVVTVLNPQGTRVRTVTAHRSGGGWVADTHLNKNEDAVILPGGLRDGYGETNGSVIR